MTRECEECLKACLPSNPRVGAIDVRFKKEHPHEYPKYLRPDCYYCPNYSEPQPEEPVKVRGLTNKERDKLNQLKAQVLYLDKQIKELTIKKKGLKPPF